MRKIFYALLVLIPLCGIVGFVQADELTTTNINISSPAGLISRNSYNFGTVKKASVTKKFTVRNVGTAELLITTIGIRELASGFELTGNNTCLNQRLTKLARCQFSVKYSPSVDTFGKTKTATLFIEGNFENSVKEVKLSAKDGLRPIANFSLYRGSNSHNHKNGVYNFNLGKTNKVISKTIYIRNTGNTTLRVSEMTKEDEAGQWQMTNFCDQNIPANKYCRLVLTFTPNSSYYNKSSQVILSAYTNDSVRAKTTAIFKIFNTLKPVAVTTNEHNTPYTTPATPVGEDVNNCPGECFGSEINCTAMGRTVDRSEAHRCQVGSSNVCCVRGGVVNEPPLAQNNCPGSCVASETSCFGAGQTIDRTEAHRCGIWGLPVCCITADVPAPTPTPAVQACPGECIMSETGCMDAGKTIDRSEGHRCTTYGYPVCCVNSNTPAPTPTPTPAHAAACTETDGLFTNAETDYNLRGTVSGYNQDGTAFSYTDSCNGNMLTEHFCAKPILNGLPVWYSFNANCSANPDHECRNGACACKPALDADGDGICNTSDLCANTPAGTAVNFAGCTSL